jgi:hypothetical protein
MMYVVDFYFSFRITRSTQEALAGTATATAEGFLIQLL